MKVIGILKRKRFLIIMITMDNDSQKTTTSIAIIAIVAALALLGVLLAAVGLTVQQPAYAQLVKDPGASFFAPGEEPKRPGWYPNGAPEDAPGQLAEVPHLHRLC
jgi:hypothetical protein